MTTSDKNMTDVVKNANSFGKIPPEHYSIYIIYNWNEINQNWDITEAYERN